MAQPPRKAAARLEPIVTRPVATVSFGSPPAPARSGAPAALLPRAAPSGRATAQERAAKAYFQKSITPVLTPLLARAAKERPADAQAFMLRTLLGPDDADADAKVERKKLRDENDELKKKLAAMEKMVSTLQGQLLRASPLSPQGSGDDAVCIFNDFIVRKKHCEMYESKFYTLVLDHFYHIDR